jgi:hypothetical protein
MVHLCHRRSGQGGVILKDFIFATLYFVDNIFQCHCGSLSDFGVQEGLKRDKKA